MRPAPPLRRPAPPPLHCATLHKLPRSAPQTALVLQYRGSRKNQKRGSALVLQSNTSSKRGPQERSLRSLRGFAPYPTQPWGSAPDPAGGAPPDPHPLRAKNRPLEPAPERPRQPQKPEAAQPACFGGRSPQTDNRHTTSILFLKEKNPTPPALDIIPKSKKKQKWKKNIKIFKNQKF